jgi:hypothetical protein
MSIHDLTLQTCDLARGEHMINPHPEPFGKVNVPDGTRGNWKVERFTVADNDVAMANLRSIRDGVPQRIVPPGEYTRLVHDYDVIMSDTPAEAYEHMRGYKNAKGTVLIAGLGLGLLLRAILTKDGIKRVVVVEKSLDVISLVAPTINDPRVKIVHGDIFTWCPSARRGEPARYDYAWYDIWPAALDRDTVGEAWTLIARFKSVIKVQDFWSREYLGHDPS